MNFNHVAKIAMVASIVGGALPYANAAADTIRAVEVQGVSGADLTKAQGLIATQVGDTLNDRTQRDDIERLYSSGNYSPDISVTMDEVSDGIKLIYHLQPCPKVGSVSFSGNKEISLQKLKDEIPAKQGEPYSVVMQDKIINSLQKLYDEKGYSDAYVSVTEYPAGNDQMNLDIIVDEGTRTKVKTVRIVGNNAFSDLRLKMSAETKGSWFTFKRWFNETKFEQDIEKLRTFYVSQGYLDATVTAGKAEEDANGITPVIIIEEGPRYKVGRVDVRGCNVFQRDEALKSFRDLAGKSYNAKGFVLSVERLKKKYANEGYLTASVEPEFHKDAARGVVDLDAVVTEGSRIYVGNVRVISRALPDDKTSKLRRWYSRFTPAPSDDVVAREVKLQPGQVYRRYDEVRTRDSLESMRIFQDVKVYDEATADPNVRNLVVDTLTGDTGKTVLGVGFGDVEGLFGYVSYVEHNLFGNATDVGFSGLVGTNAYSADFSLLMRHFMDTDWNALYNLYYRHTTRTGDIKETRLGNTVEFSTALNENVDHAIRVRLDALNYSLPSDPEPSDDTNIKNYLAATVAYRMTKRTTDDKYMPTDGYIATGAFELGAAGGFLAKASGNYTRYFDVSNNWTIVSNSTGGIMPVEAKNIGYSDRFFMGGSRDLRGFKLYGAGAHDSSAEDVPVGGSIKLMTQLEARRRVTDNFVLLGFVDGGILGEKISDISSPRAATGVGARLRLPIATVGLDLGVPILKKSEDQTQIVHFSMSSGM